MRATTSRWWSCLARGRSSLRWIWCLGILCLSTLCLSTVVVRAEGFRLDQADIAKRMKAIATRVTGLSRDLGVVRMKRSKALSEIEGIEQGLHSVYERQEVLRAELAHHRDALSRSQQDASDSSRELGVLVQEARQRLRALYMTRKGGAEDLLVFHRGDANESLFSGREFTLWRKVLASDQDLLQTLELKSREVVDRRERLNRERKLLESLQTDIQRQAGELEKKRRDRVVALKAHEANEAKIAQSLSSLRREWFRLEVLLRQLMGGDSRFAAGLRAGLDQTISGSVDRSRKASIVVVPTLKNLALPAIGRVVRPFGKRKVLEFDDYVSSNGVELLVEAGGDVKAVQKGVVRFVGEMPGFGPVVVVDHGDRMYSLYGRLQKVSVKEGSSVERATLLGTVGQPNDRGSNFYFESRYAGRPIDPIADLGVPWG